MTGPSKKGPMPTINGTQYSGSLSTRTQMVQLNATIDPAIMRPLPDLSSTDAPSAVYSPALEFRWTPHWGA